MATQSAVTIPEPSFVTRDDLGKHWRHADGLLQNPDSVFGDEESGKLRKPFSV